MYLSYATYANVFLSMFCFSIVVYIHICPFKSNTVFYIGFMEKLLSE